MKLREIADIGKSKLMVTAFGGYNKQAKISDGENHDEVNLTSDYYPFMQTRRKRAVVYQLSELPAGAEMRDVICHGGMWALVDAADPNYYDLRRIGDGFTVQAFCDKDSYLITFGAYLLAVTTQVSGGVVYRTPTAWYNTADGTSGTVVSAPTQVGNKEISVFLCNEEGNDIGNNISVGSTEPLNPVEGMYWYNTATYQEDQSGNPLQSGTLYKRYSQGWIEEKQYLRIGVNGLTSFPYKEGDYILLDKFSSAKTTGWNSKIVGNENPFEILKTFHTAGGFDSIVIEGKMWCGTFYHFDGNSTYEIDENPATDSGPPNPQISKQPLPYMDVMFESSNRLWGCRYGQNRNGDFVNEIYASKLGRFDVFDSFKGIDSDSYIVSCGTDGEFTGGADFQGSPIFFKENYMHRGYGNYPFQVTPYKCNGVKKGSEKSVAFVNNVMYFHSRIGISYYDGSLPKDMGLPFGDETFSNVVAVGNNTKFYMSVGDKMFVYDTRNGILHKEDGEITNLCSDGERVYGIVHSDSQSTIMCLSHTASEIGVQESETDFDWYAKMCITGLDIANEKYVSNIQLRFEFGEQDEILQDSQYMEIGVSYNDLPQINWVWKLPNVTRVNNGSINSFTVPIRVRRCDVMHIHLRGNHKCRILSVCKEMEQGSDQLRLRY